MSFLLSTTLLALLIASGVTAQANNTQLQVEAIEAHFSQSGLVPSLLSTFSPTAALNVQFGSATLEPGQKLDRPTVAVQPTLQLQPANSSVSLPTTFTVAMIDAGPVGTDQAQGETRHWLVNNVKLSSNQSLDAITSTTSVTNYAGPAPPAGSGPHRYVILVLDQPSNFSPPQNLSSPGVPVSVFKFSDYVSSSHLGAVVAGNYFTVEEGTASVSLSATSAVVSSTLPVPSSTGAAAPSGSGSTGSTGNTSEALPNQALGVKTAMLGIVASLMMVY